MNLLHRHIFCTARCAPTIIALVMLCGAACKTSSPAHTLEGAPQTCVPEASAGAQLQATSRKTEVPEAFEADDVMERAISFDSQGSTLQGTLTLPRVDVPRTQLPGIVILQDWGKPTRRGATKGALGIRLPVEVMVYEQLANELARNGFVVLRFDKRNCLQDTSTSCPYPRTMLEPHLENLGDVLVQDAEAALTALRAQPEVSPARIAVVGHGQGADIGLATTRGTQGPAALVLLAPSMEPIHEVITYQTRYSLEATREQLTRQGDDASSDLLEQQARALEADVKEQARLFSLVAQQPSPKDPATLYGLPLDTWRSFSTLHATAIGALSDTDRPATLAILGALDADLPESNAQAITMHLSKLPGTRVELLPDTTHDMVRIDEDTTEPPSLNPNLSAQISDFLYKNLTRP